MKAKDLIMALESVDSDSEVIVVVYTDKGYEAGYVDRIDTSVKYNSVTKEKLAEDESVVEITTKTGV